MDRDDPTVRLWPAWKDLSSYLQADLPTPIGQYRSQVDSAPSLYLSFDLAPYLTPVHPLVAYPQFVVADRSHCLPLAAPSLTILHPLVAYPQFVAAVTTLVDQRAKVRV